LSGEGLTEQNLADIGINFSAHAAGDRAGAAIPYPFGGKRARCRSISTRGAAGARPVRPGRRQRAGRAEPDHAGRHREDRQLRIQRPAQQRASKIEELGDLPIKTVNGAMVYVRDVATVRDGNPPQTNIVHVDGNRSVLMMVLKAGSASTLDIIDGIKKVRSPSRIRSLPDALKIGASAISRCSCAARSPAWRAKASIAAR
jgi:hypothetical protein